MKAHILALAIALAATCVVVRADDPSVVLPGVADLTPTTFDKVVDGKRAALIEFYAPWCGHCKSLTPEYKKLGEMVAADPTLNSQVVIAKVNADDHSELAQRFKVSGYPTIKWVPRGRTEKDAKDYNGGRDASSFIEFIKQQLVKDASFARVPELMTIAHKLMESADADRAAVVAEAKAAAAELGEGVKENADLYIKYMEKTVAKGTEYVATELARLQKLVAAGMSSTKMTEVSRKISVLSSFDKNAPVVEADEESEAEDGYGDGYEGGDGYGDGGAYGDMLENMGPDGSMYVNFD